RQHDEPGMCACDRERVELARPEALDDDVGVRDQLAHREVFQSADDRPDAVVQEPEQRVANVCVHNRAARAPAPPRVAVRGFDLHDVGAGVGKQPAAVRARDAEAEVDDTQRGQTLLHGQLDEFVAIGRKYGSWYPPSTGWNSTSTRRPTSTSS